MLQNDFIVCLQSNPQVAQVNTAALHVLDLVFQGVETFEKISLKHTFPRFTKIQSLHPSVSRLHYLSDNKFLPGKFECKISVPKYSVSRIKNIELFEDSDFQIRNLTLKQFPSALTSNAVFCMLSGEFLLNDASGISYGRILDQILE